MKLGIIGTGYVGLVTGTCLSELGHCVICADNDAAKIRLLQDGGVPIFEPGLDAIIDRNVAAGRLRFTTNTGLAVEQSDGIFISVATPPAAGGGVDLSFVEKVAREVGTAMTSYKLIIDKSTMPVKTGDKVAETIKRYCKRCSEFDVVSNPEFLREGSAIRDFMHPDRIVIGVRSLRPVPAMKEIYAPLAAPMQITDINSAEMIKHACNSFLALKISYINAISVLCDATGANVQEVAKGMGMDERIGARFLAPSLGYGGSCFPKDVSAFIKIAEEVGYHFGLLKEVEKINAGQMARFLKKITETLWVLRGKRIAVLGLAFKQNTDDIRRSPAIELCRRLQAEGAQLRVHDPRAMEKAKAALQDVEFVPDMNEVAEGCDALVIATEWQEFKLLDLERVRRSLSCPIIFDGRNLFDPTDMARRGFIYESVGRPKESLDLAPELSLPQIAAA
ncbi:MAG TPA: UDP-glucose/GDP-mannose dehydrogenase family protein [Verrucomicrobiae bacterium]|nr:UDP-glucose/GDP-mannose dehydrogenase family protein [Verrucomicrobiae bacterium]